MFQCLNVSTLLWRLFMFKSLILTGFHPSITEVWLLGRFDGLTIQIRTGKRKSVIERFCRFPLQSLQKTVWNVVIETFKHSLNCWLSTILTNTLSISSKVSPWNHGYRIRTIHHDLKEDCVFANRLSLVPNLVNCLGGNIQVRNLTPQRIFRRDLDATMK